MNKQAKREEQKKASRACLSDDHTAQRERKKRKKKKKTRMWSKWSKNVNVYHEANQTINARMKVLRMSMYKWVREGIRIVYQCE